MNKAFTDFAAAGSVSTDDVVLISTRSATVTITAATLSALASDNSYNDSGSGFLGAGFAVGNRVNVSGFTGNVANNIFVGTITALTASKMTIGGTDGDVIVDDAAGESVTITKWDTKRCTIGDIQGPPPAYTLDFGFSGGGSAITAGMQIDLGPFDFDITFHAGTLLADQTGSIQISLWSDTYAHYPPTIADSIVASAPLAISSGVKSQDTTLTGWSAVPAGNTIRANVDSVTDIQRCNVALKYTRTI